MRGATSIPRARILPALLLSGLLAGCAPALPPTAPPEGYKGPVAEGPRLGAGEYWVYERGDGKRMQFGAGSFLGNLRFPLWIGRWWSYPGEATMQRHDPAKAVRLATQIDCKVVAFKSVTVAAGTFEAFECRCGCLVYAPYVNENCGDWMIWYAPQAKNIVKIKTEASDTSMELIQYKVSGG